MKRRKERSMLWIAKNFFGVFYLSGALLSACSTTGLRLNSIPEGAEVSDMRLTSIGKTPLVLTQEQTSQISENGLTELKVVAPGYLPRLVILDAGVIHDMTVSLPKIEAGTFKSEFSRDFGKEMNHMLKSAFVIQKLIAQKKFTEATSAVEKFKGEFPLLAYGQVMSAHLALIAGNRNEATAALSRAKSLDPDDSDTVQSLKYLSGRDSESLETRTR